MGKILSKLGYKTPNLLKIHCLFCKNIERKMSLYDEGQHEACISFILNIVSNQIINIILFYEYMFRV